MDDPTAAAAPVAEPLEPRLLLAAALADVRLDGDFVVWSALVGTDREIFAYGPDGLRQLTDNAFDDTSPHLDGSVVVWQGKVGTTWEIFVYDLLADSAPRRLTDNVTNDTAPQIEGGTVVWLAHDGRCDQVVRYDLATGTRMQLSSGTHAAKYARIGGGNITWYAFDGTDDEIYLYDGTAVRKVTNNTRTDKTPRVSATHVVWRASDGNDDEVFLYDIATGETTPVTDNAHHDDPGGLTDRAVVWAGHDGSDYDIYACDIESGQVTALTDNTANDWSPNVTADGAVWVDGNTGQVWRYDDATGSASALTDDGGPHASPAATTERAVWIRDDVLVLLNLAGDGEAVWFTPFAPVAEPLVWIEDASAPEGNSAGALHFVVRLSAPTDHPVTLRYRAVADGDAIAGTDFEAVEGTVTFLPGDVARTVGVPIVGELQLEADETFSVTLSDVAGAVLAGGAATGTILDDDTPEVSILDATVQEGNDGLTALHFTVRLSRPIVSAAYPVTVRYETVAAAATPGDDYTADEGEITFVWGGPVFQTVTVYVRGDTEIEPHETLGVRLRDAVHARLARAEAVGTIANDDTSVSFDAASARLVLDEGGDKAATTFTFTVALAQPSALPVTVDWATTDDAGADHAATAGEDYTAACGSLTFAPGQTHRTFAVTVKGDTDVELDETFAVVLSNAAGAAIGVEGGRAIGVISDDDAPRLSIDDPAVLEGACRVSIYDVTAPEGDTGDMLFVFALSLSQAMDEPVTVTFEVRGATAVAGEDFAVPDQTAVTFAPRQTRATITVRVLGDPDADEAVEWFTVALTDVTPGVLLDRRQAVGRILNDEAAYASPRVSVYDLAWAEGDEGSAALPVLIRCLPAPSQAVTVEYEVLYGSAGAADFDRPSAGSHTFAADQTDWILPITVHGDRDVEPNESFTVRLTRVTGGASLGDATATVTIVNDDDAPAVLEFTVRLDKASQTGDVTVAYATALDTRTPEGDAKIFAASQDDFEAVAGTLTFTFDGPAPVLTQTIRVPIRGDLQPEDDETFLVKLLEATRAKVFDDTGVGTIVNDDTLIGFDADSLEVSLAEGDAGATEVTLDLVLSHAITPPVSVRWITEHLDGRTDDDDYAAVGAPGREAAFAWDDAAKAYRATITIQIAGDGTIELDETFVVRLIDPAGGTLDEAASVAMITILDDDTPLVSILDASAVETDGGQTLMEFTVQLSKPNAERAVTVAWRTEDDAVAAHPATAGEDYAAASGELVFPIDETRLTFVVPVAGDEAVEADETFGVRLTAADGALLDDGDDATTADRPAAVGTIRNDDTGIRICDVQCTEGTGPDTAVRLTVELTEATTETVTVWYTTADGTATLLNDDYVPAGDMLTFAPTVTRRIITVYVRGDARVENDETFFVTLSGAANAALVDAEGRETDLLHAAVTIADDDLPWLSILDASFIEGDAGGALRFKVTLTGAAATETVTVGYATAGGDATAGADYAATSGWLTFEPEQTEQWVTVPVFDDNASEPDETVIVTLTAPAGVKTIDGEAVGTIRNDDAELRLADGPLAVQEGDTGETNLDVTVELVHPVAHDVTVTVQTADGSARAGRDYRAVSVPLTLAAGQRSATAAVPILGDGTTESDETFEMRLVDPQGATVAGPAATATIVNDDAMPRVSIADASVREGDGGTTAMDLTVTLSNDSELTITVPWRTEDGPVAAAGTHYEPVTDGILTFNPGDTTVTLTVYVYGDTAPEPDAAFTVTLGDPPELLTNATIADGQAVATILNDDTTVSIDDAWIDEGDAGEGILTLTVSLSAPVAFEVSFTYATLDDTATAEQDYAAKGETTLTFAPHQTTRWITVPILGDGRTEADETFFVDLLSAANAVVARARATATIRNDDPEPTVAIEGGSLLEDEGSLALTVRLSRPSDWTVTVDYAAADGSARANEDYVPAAGTLTFAPGAVTATILVRLLDDADIEPNETFSVTLGNPQHASIGGAQAVATILDDDQPAVAARLSVAPAGEGAVVEGDGGTALLTFDVTLDRAVPGEVAVRVVTLDGTARAGADYQAITDQTLRFGPNDTHRTVTVLVWGDALDEDDETFTLMLLDPDGAVLAADSAAGIILDDDDPPQVNIADASLTEGDDGSAEMMFHVTLTAASGRTITVDYATAEGTAAAGADYDAAGGTLTFEPGQTETWVAVAVLGDGLAEHDETFTVNLTAAANATIADGQAVGTIRTDEPLLPRPDLAAALGPVALPAMTIPGDRARVTATIANAGDARAAGTAVVRLYASADGILDAADTPLGASAPVRLNLLPGRARKLAVWAVVPDTLPVGAAWYVLAQVEPVAGIDDLLAANNVTADATARTTQWRFGSLDGRRGAARLNLPDTAGTPVAYSLAGGGWGEIVALSDGRQTVALHATTAASVLTVATTGGRRARLAGIEAAGPVAKVVARTADVAGDVTLNGASLLDLGDVTGGTITLGATPNAAATVRLGNVTDTTLTSGADLKALVARSWRDTGGAAERVAAPSLGKLVVDGGAAGHFGAVLDLGAGHLGAAVVAGDVTGRWTAGSAGSIAIRGSLLGGSIELSSAAVGRGTALGKLVVAGDVTGAAVRTRGSIGRVQVGSLHASRLLAGVSPAVADHPASRADLVEPRAAIAALTVTGTGGRTDRFVSDSRVAAGSLGVINLLNADFGAGGGIGLWADGAAARPVGRVVHLDRLTGDRWAWPVRRGLFAGPDDLIHLLV